jgi:hypothetical protein
MVLPETVLPALGAVHWGGCVHLVGHAQGAVDAAELWALWVEWMLAVLCWPIAIIWGLSGGLVFLGVDGFFNPLGLPLFVESHFLCDCFPISFPCFLVFGGAS